MYSREHVDFRLSSFRSFGSLNRSHSTVIGVQIHASAFVNVLAISFWPFEFGTFRKSIYLIFSYDFFSLQINCLIQKLNRNFHIHTHILNVSRNGKAAKCVDD